MEHLESRTRTPLAIASTSSQFQALPGKFYVTSPSCPLLVVCTFLLVVYSLGQPLPWSLHIQTRRLFSKHCIAGVVTPFRLLFIVRPGAFVP
jgi:hypothetical protein